MFIQIFSVLGIIIILVHLLVFFIFPKTYLETRKEEVYNKANEISSIMNGKEIKYIEQTLELYSKSSEIKAFIKERNNNNNEIQIKDNIDANLESNSNSLIIEEREIKLNDGKKTNLQFVSTADMQKDAKDLSLKFLPYSLLISILFSAIISLIYAKLIKNQRIIAENAQFTGIAAGQGVGFTTGLLHLRKGLGMRETPIRPHSWHCRMQSDYQYD